MWFNASDLEQKKIIIVDDLYTFDENQLEKVIKSLNNDLENVILFAHNAAITNFVNKFGDIFIENVPTSGLVWIKFDCLEWKLLKKGKIQKVFQSEEFKYYLFGIIGVSAIVTVIVHFFQDPTLVTSIAHPKVLGELEYAIRHSLFMVTSVVTTTGFVTADYTTWNLFATGIFFALFFTGGSAGSTSGGVKIVRHIIMLKNSFLEFKKTLHPSAIIPVRYDGKSVNQQIVFNILSFFIIYMLIFILASVILTLFGMDFFSALGAAASSLGNIGPAVGSVNPVANFNHLTNAAKLFCSFLMLIGRLELFTVLILFTPFFWRKN